MSKTMVTGPISLGNKEKGEKRLDVLLDWAEELDLTWNGEPSLSKLIQHLADERIKNAQADCEPGTCCE